MVDRVVRQVLVPQPPEVVWPALVEPARLARWLVASAEVDFIPGAIGSVVLADGEVRRVRVEVVEPPRRLVFRWRTMTVGAVSSEVEVTLEPSGGGTTVRVVESSGIVDSPGGTRPALARA